MPHARRNRASLVLPALVLSFAAIAKDKQEPNQPPPPSGSGSSLRGYAERRPHRMKEEFDELGQSLDAANVTTDACSYDDALKRARAWTGAKVKPEALAALKADPSAKNAAQLMGLAGVAAATGRPGAAIAALLEAVALEPDRALALADLAAALSGVGLCAEAVAIADAAAAKAKDKMGPLGIPIAAVALNAKGVALLRQGKPKDAVPVLKQAVALAGPVASDAALNLAVALKQSGDEDEAKKVYYLACWRRTVDRPFCSGGRKPRPGDPRRSPYDRGVTTREPTALAFDLHYGKDGKFPTFRHPQNVRQFKAFETFYKREEKEQLEFQQSFMTWTQSQVNKRPGNTPSDKRALMVVQYVELIDDDPDIEPLYSAMNKQAEDLADKYKRIIQGAQLRVLAIIKAGGSEREIQAKLLESANSTINEINGPANAFDDVLRKYWAKAYRYQLGLAANIQSPYWHDRASWRIRLMKHTVWFRLLKTTYDMYNGAYLIHGSPKETAGQLDVPEKRPEDEESPECPEGLEDSSLEYSAGPLSITVSCESLGMELSTEGPLQGFVSLDVLWEGKMTVLAGAKLDLEGKGPLPGFTMRDGIYMTCDKNGQIEDFGGRVNFEAFKEVHGVRIKHEIDKMDFSLMPRVQ